VGVKQMRDMYSRVSQSTDLQLLLKKCFLLNFGLLVVYHVVFVYLLIPLGHAGMQSLPLPQFAVIVMEYALILLYYACWLLPSYVIINIKNFEDYPAIAKIVRPSQGGSQSLAALLADIIYGTILGLALLAQSSLCSFIPYIGWIVSFIYSCLWWSVSSYDYRWASMGYTLEQRLQFVEKRWVYFFGLWNSC